MYTKVNSLTQDQSKTLSNWFYERTIDGTSFYKYQRDNLIFLLMLDAGLRVGEVVRLHVSDLIFDNEPVKALFLNDTIALKASMRTVPLSIRIQAQIKRLLLNSTFTIYNSPSEKVFLGNSAHTPISVRQIQRIIGLASNTALGFEINPHRLRHTFASNLMRITNIRTVQCLLGHKNLSSTQVYTHPNSEDLSNAIHSLPT